MKRAYEHVLRESSSLPENTTRGTWQVTVVDTYPLGQRHEAGTSFNLGLTAPRSGQDHAFSPPIVGGHRWILVTFACTLVIYRVQSSCTIAPTQVYLIHYLGIYVTASTLAPIARYTEYFGVPPSASYFLAVVICVLDLEDNIPFRHVCA